MMKNDTASLKSSYRKAFLTPLIYLIVSTIWIFSSDWIVDHLVTDRDILIMIQSGKGFFFVLATTLLLLVLIRNNLREIIAHHRLLQESEERFRQALIHAPFPIMIHGEDHRIIFLNQEWFDITGYALEEASTTTEWIEKAHNTGQETNPQKINDIYQKIQHEGKGESIIITKSGEQRIWDIYSSPLGTTSEGRSLVMSMAMDITHRKQAENALKEQKEVLQTILDHIPIMIVFLEANRTVRWINHCFEKTLGWSLEECRRNDLIVEMYPDPEIRESIREFFQSANETWREFPIRLRDGNQLDSSWMFIPLLDGCKIAIGQDLTERKQIEAEKSKYQEQLLQAQKMESIGRLAGGIAHDFNNLLLAIKGYSTFAIEAVEPYTPIYEDLIEVQKASDRAAALTRQLLAYSRKQVLQPVILDLNELILNTDKMLRRLIGEDIDFVTIPTDQVWKVKADPGQLEQVLINLAVNARDALPRGGILTIETKNVILDEDYTSRHLDAHPGSYVMIAVSDNGIGMSREIIEKIFDPFFTTKEKGKGTGLGLSTVLGIIKQSGGFVYVYSEPEKGTSVKIYLPRVEEEMVSGDPKLPDILSVEGKETILLIEDEDMVRRIVKRAILDHGYRILETRDGEEAITISQQHFGKIDLMITDVILPKMSGRELADQLALTRPEMSILYMSGYTDNAIVHHGMLDQGIHFIQKPFSTDEFLKKIRKILDRQ